MARAALGAILLILNCVSTFSQQAPPGTLRQIIPGHYCTAPPPTTAGSSSPAKGWSCSTRLNSEAVARAQRDSDGQHHPAAGPHPGVLDVPQQLFERATSPTRTC